MCSGRARRLPAAVWWPGYGDPDKPARRFPGLSGSRYPVHTRAARGHDRSRPPIGHPRPRRTIRGDPRQSATRDSTRDARRRSLSRVLSRYARSCPVPSSFSGLNIMKYLLMSAVLIGVAIGSITGFRAQAPSESPALKPTGGRGLTEVPGIKVGSHTLSERLTGCTVIIVDGEGVPGGMSQRGGAPGTVETDLLQPLNMVDRVNAIVLAGGSAYGLDARQGVVKYLEERNIGWKVGSEVLPIVPAAILMDLGFGGQPKIRPTSDCGYRAANS